MKKTILFIFILFVLSHAQWPIVDGFPEWVNKSKGEKVASFVNPNSTFLNLPGADATELNPGTGDFTLEMFFKTRSLTTEYLFNNGANTANDKTIRLVIVATTLYVRVGDGSGSYWIDFTYGVSAYTEYYLALVCDRNGAQTLYINTVSQSTQSVTNSIDISNTDDTTIGAISGGATTFFHGYMMRVIWSDVARGTSYLDDSYVDNISVDANHVAFWDFNKSLTNDQAGANNLINSGVTKIMASEMLDN